MTLITSNQIEGNIGGSSNETEKIVKNQAQLIEPLINKENKILISKDIVLTSDITLPDGADIVDNGGSIDVNGYEVTFVNNDLKDSKWNFFKSDYTDGLDSNNRIDIIRSNNSKISDASTFKDIQTIFLENFGLIGDGDLETNSGSDNRNCLLEVQKIAHKTNCDIHIVKKGNYLYNVTESASNHRILPKNFYLKDKSNFFIGDGVVIGALTNTHERYDIVAFEKPVNSRFYGQGTVVGDLKTHVFTGGTNHEYCYGVLVLGDSDRFTMEVDVREVSGDCFVPRYGAVVKYIRELEEANFTKASEISDIDGTVIINNDKAYSKRFSLAEYLDYDMTVLSQDGIKEKIYNAVFYGVGSSDLNTTDGFLFKTDYLETSTGVTLPQDATHVRVEILTPVDWATQESSIYFMKNVNNLTIKGSKLSYGVRQGISNLRPYNVVDGVIFENIGRRFSGEAGAPGYAIDIEDGFPLNHHIQIKNCRFRNINGGFIIAYQARYLQIYGNSFEATDNPKFKGKSINVADTEDAVIYNNDLINGAVGLGTRTKFYNNIIKNTSLNFVYKDEEVYNITNGENINFQSVGFLNLDGTGLVRNSKFIRTTPLKEGFVFSGMSNVIFKDVVYDFRGKVYSNTNTKLSGAGASHVALGGLYNTEILNIVANNPTSDEYQTFAYDIKDSKIETSIGVQGGLPRDFTWENLKVKGRVRFQLSNYPNTGIGDFKTATINNIEIKPLTEDFSQYLNILKCNTKDINLVFNGGSITTASSYQNNILDLTNNGTKIFNGTKFISPVSANQALDSTYTFIDCEFDNITFTGVVFKYTKPNSNCPTYVDNATALSALGEGYYYKLPSGEFKITY